MKIAVFGSYNGTSVGDTAILLGLLRAIALAAPRAEVTVLSMGPIDLSQDLALADLSTEPKLVRANAWSFQEAPVLRSILWRAGRWVPYGKWLGPINAARCRSLFEQHDLLIIGGGNLLMTLFESNVRIIDTICNAARAVKVPYAFVGVGAGPIDGADARAVLGSCLAGAQTVIVRDEASRRLCREKLGRDDTLRAPDLAFALQDAAQAASRRGALALNLASVGDKTWPRRDETRYRGYVEGFVRLAHTAVLRYRPQRVDIVSTNAAVDHRASADVLAALIKGSTALTCPVVASPCADVASVLAAFSQADLAITTRLHAGILAAISGCRVLAIAYDTKVRAVLAEEQIAPRSIDLDELADPDSDPAALLDAAETGAKRLTRSVALAVVETVRTVIKMRQ